VLRSATTATGSDITRLRKTIMTMQLSGVNFASSATNGIVTVGLPTMASALSIPAELRFWPLSVWGLAMCATLLLAGSVADVLGPRRVDLAGCLCLAAATLGAGFAQTASGLIACRALQGVAMSLHMSSSVSIVAANLPRGRGRNIAFSCLGLSQPLGYSVGLVLGGVLIDTVGWRVGWYLFGGFTGLLFVVGLWALPRRRMERRMSIFRQLVTTVDWVGAGLASTFMACLSYLLA